MRNINGYGSVYKLSGKRRKPWCVRITKGWEGEKQVREILGTYKTKEEAEFFSE